ncbi:MAG TPA: SDR family oxidoreductase [Bacteroidota bacterium]|nr:SDR family oxidoreductase [Bacteroidota bacterium]
MSEHFFITGGTGLVGINLVSRIVKAYPDSRITLLVRGKSQEQIDARISAIAASEGIPGERMSGVRGDVLSENCGLTQEELAQIERSATYIVHGAATTRFDHPIEEAREINCGGTRRILAIAERCMQKGSLKRFVYIGTSSVSGQRAGPILEDELEKNQIFFNTYEQSKCESERIVRDHFGRIPSVIFRPSIIIGDSRTGRTSTFNVIYIPLRLLQRGLLTFVPGDPDTKMDLVPIDWVDDAMVHIMGKEEAIGTVCHITAGPTRAARLGDVVMGATSYFDRWTPLPEPRHMEFVSREEFERRKARARGREEALMAQLNTLLPYISINRLFDSRTADTLLEGSGIRFPAYNDYAERILSYCLKTNWGKIPA